MGGLRPEGSKPLSAAILNGGLEITKLRIDGTARTVFFNPAEPGKEVDRDCGRRRNDTAEICNDNIRERNVALRSGSVTVLFLGKQNGGLNMSPRRNFMLLHWKRLKFWGTTSV